MVKEEGLSGKSRPPPPPRRMLSTRNLVGNFSSQLPKFQWSPVSACHIFPTASHPEPEYCPRASPSTMLTKSTIRQRHKHKRDSLSELR